MMQFTFAAVSLKKGTLIRECMSVDFCLIHTT